MIRPDPEYSVVVGRIRRMALIATFLLFVGIWFLNGPRAATALGVSAALMLMNFFWLEEILLRTMNSSQGADALFASASIFVRFGLIGIAAIVTIGVARFEPISVILGFSVIVIAIMAEAARSLIESLSSSEDHPDEHRIDDQTGFWD